MNIDRITAAMNRKGYHVFKDDSKPYNLNIVGVRSCSLKSNEFNGWRYIFWKHNGLWSIISQKITTDPGLFWKTQPHNPLGAIVLKEGQYLGCWQIGKHLEKHDALVQVKPVTVIRDDNRNIYLSINGVEDRGLFSINHHAANDARETIDINRWRPGCQVTAHFEDHQLLMHLARKSAIYWDNSFSYTLLDEKDLKI